MAAEVMTSNIRWNSIFCSTCDSNYSAVDEALMSQTLPCPTKRRWGFSSWGCRIYSAGPDATHTYLEGTSVILLWKRSYFGFSYTLSHDRYWHGFIECSWGWERVRCYTAIWWYLLKKVTRTVDFVRQVRFKQQHRHILPSMHDKVKKLTLTW